MKRIAQVISIGLIAATVMLTGCSNKSTPAGYVGYVTQGAYFGKDRFVKTQIGPTSTGLRWLYHVTNISVTPYTYTEAFDVRRDTGVLAKDQLAVSFNLHITFRIQPTEVRQFVEGYSTISPGESPDQIVQTAYNNFVKEPARTAARTEVEQFDGLDIQNHINEITTNIRKRLDTILEKTPFEVLNVVVGNIQYPKNVTDAVAAKIAAKQELERQSTIKLITIQKADQRREEAKGVADAMRIINNELTPQYNQYEAIKAQMAMVNSPNHTTIYIPVGPMGVPIVNDVSQPARSSSPAPKPAANN